MRLLRSSALARWARLSGGASSILAGRSDGTPTRARWPGLMNAPSIHSVSAAAGALRRLESVWMHRSACWAGYPSDSSRRLTAVGASHTSSIATAQGLKDYDYADDVDCHHRHRAPAAAAVGPVPPRLRASAEVGHAPARAGVTHPHGVLASRQWRISAARRHVTGRAHRNHFWRPAGCMITVTVVRAGARCVLIAGGVTTLIAGGRAARSMRPPPGRGAAAAGAP